VKIIHYSIIEEPNIDKLEKRINKAIRDDGVQPLGGLTYNPKTGNVCQVVVDVEGDDVEDNTAEIVRKLDEVNENLDTLQKTLRLNQP
jgi:uncharacterized protein YcgI (DUF1989 family)